MGRGVKKTFRMACIAMLIATVAFPLYWMAIAPFKTFAEFFGKRPVFWPGHLDLAVFRDVLIGDRVLLYFLNSLLVAGVASAFTLALAVPAAYALARLSFRGSGKVSGAFFMVYLFPAVVLMVPLYAMLARAGLIDTRAGLVLSYLAQTLPVGVLLLANYFRALPEEIEEAGMVDGLTRVGVVCRVAVPLAAPAIAVVAFYVFVIAWNEFLFAFMFLTDEALFTLPIGLNRLHASYHTAWDKVMAASCLMTFPVIALFIAFERHLVEGLTSGGVKG